MGNLQPQTLFRFVCLLYTGAAVATLSHAQDAVGLENWGTGATLRIMQCAKNFPDCGAAIPVYNPPFVDGYQQTSTLVDYSHELGWVNTLVELQEIASGVTAPIHRGAATSKIEGAATASSWAIEGYAYNGSDPITLTITGTVAGEISNPIDSGFNIMAGLMAIIPPEDIQHYGTTHIFHYINQDQPLDFNYRYLTQTGSSSFDVSIELVDGDTFYLWSELEFGAAGGGYSDAPNGLTITFSHTDNLHTISKANALVPVTDWFMQIAAPAQPHTGASRSQKVGPYLTVPE